MKWLSWNQDNLGLSHANIEDDEEVTRQYHTNDRQDSSSESLKS